MPRRRTRRPDVRIKRVYESPDPDDGARILVDRIWPRGVPRDRAMIDAWAKDLAPSTDLRKWFGHDPARFDEFERRYRAELDGNPAIETLAARARRETVTLVYSARDEANNQAVVLAAVVEES